jgi:hypothetical protein
MGTASRPRGSTIGFYMEYVKGKNNTPSILILLLNGAMVSTALAKPYPLPQETFLGLSELPQQSGPSALARRPIASKRIWHLCQLSSDQDS